MSPTHSQRFALSEMRILRGLLALTWVLAAVPVSAQVDRAVLSGTVADESQASVPGATLTLTDSERGLVWEAVSDGEGRFRLVNLPPGLYDLRTALPGFQTTVRQSIRLTVGQEEVLRIVLKAGEVTEEVVVSAAPPIIQTTTSSISGLVNEKTIRELPLNGRSFEQLATFQVGVTRVQFGTRDVNAGFGQKISLAGARPNQTRYLLDGADINPQSDNPGSVAGLLLGVEAVQEFRVQTSTYGAQYGKSAGGVINVVTKSGTNNLHGSIFEYHRNDNLDARNFFDPGSPPEFKRNQFGFSAGGPILRDRTFFFTSYEGLRERLGLTSLSTVPSVDARAGLVPDPTTGELVNVGVAPVIRPYLELYPLPNGRDFDDGTAELVRAVNRPTNQDYIMGRIDHRLSDRDSFYGRYVIDDGDITDPGELGLFEQQNQSRAQFFSLEETRIVSSSIVNAFRFSFNRTFTDSVNAAVVDIPSALDLSPVFPFGVSGAMSPGSDVASLGGNSSLPKIVAYNVFEWADDVTISWGRHALKVGALGQRVQWNSASWSDGGGGLEFLNLGDFLAGKPNRFSSVVPGSDAVRGYRMTFVDLYIQDDMQLTPNVTLNLGLRYGYASDPTEVNGKASNYPADRLATAPVVGNPLFEEDKLNVDPRLGFAWNVFGHSKLALRGGAGVFSQPLTPYHWQTAAVRQSPFFFRAQTSQPPFSASHDPFDALPSLEEAVGTTQERPDSIHYTKRPSTVQYNLTAQVELQRNLGLTLAAVGARGINLSHGVEWNSVVPDVLPDGQKFFPADRGRRNPSLGRHIVTETTGDSWYNAFVLGLERRFDSGLQFQASYTYGKSIDVHSAVFAAEFTGGSARTPLDPDDHQRDKALSDFDVRHNFSFGYVYELPFGPGKPFGANLQGLPKVLLAGWQVNGIVSLASGSPRLIQNTHDQSRHLAGDTSGHDRPDLVPGASNNPVLGGPDRYFDVSAFRLQEPGVLGTVGRNTLIGPGVATVDLSLVKNIAVAESRMVQFRAEFFNLLNRPNFGSPNTEVFTDASGVPSGSAGRIRTTTTTSRQIQFALRFSW